MYRRLPKGPHQLTRQEVTRNQRDRMFGAMVETLAEHGYAEATVKRVVGLAGVSRRSFYEQFSGKEDCFLMMFDETVDCWVAKARSAYGASRGDFEERLQAVLQALLEITRTNPKRARLVIRDPQAVGEAGMARLQKLLGGSQQALGGYLEATTGQSQLPAPLLRGIIGGLSALFSLELEEQRAGEVSAEEMLRWTMLSAQPGVGQLRYAVPAGGVGEKEDPPFREQIASGVREASDGRTRMFFSALYIVVTQGYSELSPNQIARIVGLSVDEFFETFTSVDECYQQALGHLADEILRVVADASALGAAEWPDVVRSSLVALTSHLAEHPICAHAMSLRLHESGPSRTERGLRVAREIASSLTARAPLNTGGSHTVEMIGGAIWHTIHFHASKNRLQLLPAVVDHLTYLALAPYLGAQEALDAVKGPQREQTLVAVG